MTHFDIHPRLRRVLRVGLAGFFVALGGFGVIMAAQAAGRKSIEIAGVAIFTIGFALGFGAAVTAFAVATGDLWHKLRSRRSTQ